MKKILKNKLFIFTSMIIVLLLSILFISLKYNSPTVSPFIDNFQEEVEEYCKEQNIEPTNGWLCENFKIITFDEDNKYGIVGFFMDNTTKEIKIVENIRNVDEFKNVDYLEIQDDGGNNVYMCIFIFNDEFVKRLEDVSIIFGDSKPNKPFEISISCYRYNSVIIDYSSNEIREIEKIILTDKNGNEIYSQ